MDTRLILAVALAASALVATATATPASAASFDAEMIGGADGVSPIR